MSTRYLSYSEPFAVKNIEIFELDMDQHADITVIREGDAVVPRVRLVSGQTPWPSAVSEALRWHLPAGETAVLQTTAIVDDRYCQSTGLVVQADGSAKQVEHPAWQQSLLMAAGVAGLAGMTGIAGAAAFGGTGGSAPATAAAGGSGLDMDKATETVGKAAKFITGLFSDDDEDEDEDEDGEEDEAPQKKKAPGTKTRDGGNEEDAAGDEEEEDEEEEDDDDDDDFDF